MRILVAHNSYHISGGGDRVAWESARLFEEKGHTIIPFSMKNPKNWPTEYSSYFADEIDYSKIRFGLKNLKTAARMVYSSEAKKKMTKLIQDTRPEIAHLHNIYGRLTPSILLALKKHNIPVVMTLHDYKLICPSYTLFNQGRPCDMCEGKKFYHAVKTKCHKNSYLASAASCGEAYIHKWFGLYQKNVDYFISPSRFLIDKMLEAGLPPNKFVHIPNFIDIKTYSPGSQGSAYILYQGRLSQEKGVPTLFKSMQSITAASLQVAGDGNLRENLEEHVKQNEIKNVKFLGHLDKERLIETIRHAAFVVLPSECYENFPMTVLEAFSLGKPVVGSRIGGITEIIDDTHDGLLFTPGDADDLTAKISYLLDNPAKVKEMGENAREKIEKSYNAELYYTKLLELYTKTIRANS